MKTSYVAVIVVVVIAIIAIGGYYATSGMKHYSASTSTVASPASTTVQAAPNIPYTTTVLSNSSSAPSTSIAPANSIVTDNGISYTIKVESNSTVGNYLVDGAGFTLYHFDADKPYSNTSACNTGCDGVWPPFYNSTLTLAPGLNASNFTVITRSDGSKQLTYEGYPLYTYSHDTRPGQLNGEGIDGVWFAYTTNVPVTPVPT